MLNGLLGASIFSDLTEAASAVAQMVVSIFNTIVNVFWTPGTAATETAAAVPGEITVIGQVCLMALFVGIAFYVINWVRATLTSRRG